MTLGPVALGFVGAFGLTVFSIITGPFAAGIAAGGFLVGATNWAIRFFAGRDAYTQKYFAKLHEEFDKMKEEKTEQLAKDLKKLGCDEGRLQVSQFEDKFQTLVNVFGRVFSENELTYSRLKYAAEQAYTSALANLERIVVQLTSIADIERDDIESRIIALGKKQKRTASDERTLQALQSQALVYDQTHQEVRDILATNEEALATMDQTGVAVVRLKDRSATDSPKRTMEEATELLKQLIAKSKTSKIAPENLLEVDSKSVAQK
ncbi:MAG: hypothetical protein PHG25_02715 [Candidatus Pacebacteria bacterium]|nr:hypothetical protein [Candidatus Paceibacterota bacterium]